MAVSLLDTPTGQVRVETGKGRITMIHDGDSRNVKVEIDAEHLREPVTGWLDTQNALLRDIAFEAWQTGEPIEYRIEVKRKRDVAPERPLADLGNREKVRELAQLKDGQTVAGNATDGQTITPPQSPEPSRAPQSAANGARPVQSPPQNQSGASEGPPPDPAPLTPANIREHQEQASAARHVVHVPSPSARGRHGRGPRIEEAKPWEFFNTDGNLNLGSYAATAVMGAASMAYELVMERIRTSAVTDGAPLKPPNPDSVEMLARHIIDAADSAQAAVRPDGHADRMDASHTRARGAVRQALDIYPPPWSEPREAWDAWHERITEQATTLLQIGIKLLQDE